MTDVRKEPPLAQGVYAALATPRRANSIEADTAALLDYLDAIASAGVEGLVLFGSTGEFVHFESEERIRATGLAIKRSRVPVLVNVSHSTLAGAVAIAGSARDAGAAGLLLTPPYFYRYPADQIFEFYLQFVKLVGRETPIYLYNLPMFLNPISPDLVKRLLETGAFAGIKDSGGDWSYFELLKALRSSSPFQLLVGNEAIYLRGRSAGADGTVSGIAGAVPELMVALDRAIIGGETQRAERLNERLLEFLDQVNRFPVTVAIRQAAAMRGWSLSQTAVPFDEDTAADVIAFHGWFREWSALVLPECRQALSVRT